LKRRWLLAALPLIAYFWVVVRHAAYAVGGPDSSGYMNEARMFAAGQLKVPVTPLQTMKLPISFTHCFTPLGFLTSTKGRMVPSYPPGLPVHFAIAGKLFGWTRAPYVLVALLATLSLVVMFGIARELGLSRIWSYVAAMILASVPIVLSSAVQPMSDDVAMFWALVAMYCALRSQRNASFAIFAGIALGVGVWVRPTNLLLALPMALAMRFRWPLLWRTAVGALPIGLALAWYQKVQFGSALRTGYGTAGEMLQASIIAKCAPHHFLWLVKTMSPLAILGLFVVVADKRVDRWTRVLLPIWIGIFFAFYMAYDICSDWWDTRFLLPGLPALILASILVLQRIATTRVRSIIAAVLALVMLITPITMARKLRVFGYGKGEQQWPRWVNWAESKLPPDSLLIGGIFCGAFYYYSGRYMVRWDQLESDDFQLMRAYAGNANLHWYAMMSSVADMQEEELAKRYPGNWTVVAREREVTLWRLEE